MLVAAPARFLLDFGNVPADVFISSYAISIPRAHRLKPSDTPLKMKKSKGTKRAVTEEMDKNEQRSV